MPVRTDYIWLGKGLVGTHKPLESSYRVMEPRAPKPGALSSAREMVRLTDHSIVAVSVAVVLPPPAFASQ